MNKNTAKLKQQFDDIESNNKTHLTLKRVHSSHLDIFDGYYKVGSLRVLTKTGEIIFYQKNPELFKNHDGFGILKSVLTNPLFPFVEIRFIYNGILHTTTRQTFLENGIKEEYPFGVKLFLPRKKFIKVDPEQPTFNF